MSGYFLVNQAPFQFVWCSTGLGQYQTGTSPISQRNTGSGVRIHILLTR
jgi:hypothetical protein